MLRDSRGLGVSMSDKNITVRDLLRIISEGGLSPREKETVARCILRAQINRTSDELDLTRLTTDEHLSLELLIARVSVTVPS